MKYIVTTTSTAVFNIVVNADSKEHAKELVLEGDYNEEYNVPDAFINEEIFEVKEFE